MGYEEVTSPKRQRLRLPKSKEVVIPVSPFAGMANTKLPIRPPCMSSTIVGDELNNNNNGLRGSSLVMDVSTPERMLKQPAMVSRRIQCTVRKQLHVASPAGKGRVKGKKGRDKNSCLLEHEIEDARTIRHTGGKAAFSTC